MEHGKTTMNLARKMDQGLSNDWLRMEEWRRYTWYFRVGLRIDQGTRMKKIYIHDISGLDWGWIKDETIRYNSGKNNAWLRMEKMMD